MPADKVVVIGGGFAGSLIARSLQFEFDLTLIDSKEYFEITWASARSRVEPSFAQRSVINHKDYMTNGRVVVSEAVNITEKEVHTEERVVPYDYLVIATGHPDHNLPTTKRERLAQYQSDNERIKAAQSILIIGGGPAGVELAGEIAVDYPEKRVTLVHGGYRLMEFIGPVASKKALEWLRKHNVNVKLEQKIDMGSISEGSRTYRTTTGEVIEADCHFVCTGRPLGSNWLKETMLKSYLDRDGRLMVDQYLRVKGLTNVFAIGDITDLQEMKQGRLAQKHAKVAAKNVGILMRGEEQTRMESYEAGTKIAFVSLGRKVGLAQFPYWTTRGWIPGLIKSKDLFVGRVTKMLGMDPHIVHS